MSDSVKRREERQRAAGRAGKVVRQHASPSPAPVLALAMDRFAAYRARNAVPKTSTTRVRVETSKKNPNPPNKGESA